MTRRTDTHHVHTSMNGSWVVRRGGAHRASARFETKKAAIDRGDELSRKHGTDLVIHREDGTIEKHVPAVDTSHRKAG